MNRLSLNKEIDKIFKAEQEGLAKADRIAIRLEKKIKVGYIKLLIEDMLNRTKEDLSKESYRFLWESLIYNEIKGDLIVAKTKDLTKEEKVKFLEFMREIFIYLKEIQDSGSFNDVENDCNPYMIFKSFFDKVKLLK